MRIHFKLLFLFLVTFGWIDQSFANSGTNYVTFNRGMNITTNCLKFSDDNQTNSGIQFADGSFLYTTTNLIQGITNATSITLDRTLIVPNLISTNSLTTGNAIVTNNLVVSNNLTAGNATITNNLIVSNSLTAANISITNSLNITNKIIFSSSNPTNSGIQFADGTFLHSASSQVIIAIEPTITITNPTFTVSEYVSAWRWIPILTNALRPSFTTLSTGFATMGEIYFVNTNNNPIVWTNITEFVVNGISQSGTNPPTLGQRNILIFKCWDTNLSIWVVNTNSLVR